MDQTQPTAAPPAAQQEAELQAAFAQAAARPQTVAEEDGPPMVPDTVEPAASAPQEPAPDPEAVLPVLADLLLQNHVHAIAQSHPDWREIAAGPDLPAWIDSHPEYLAQPLRQVRECGCAEDVVDLLDRFKASQGQGPNAKLNAARLLQALSAAAVPSRTAGPPAERPDQDDFSAAWQAATRDKA